MEKNKTQIIPLPNFKKKNFNAAEYKANNVLGRKIEEARRAKGVSMRGLMALLAEYGLDLDYQIVYKWEKGKTVPNAIQLLAVCEALEIPDAYRYLTDGEDDLNEEGLRKLLAYRDDLLATGKYKPQSREKKEVGYVEMPVSLLGASAGTGEFLSGENIELMRFPENGVPAKADYAVRVVGDSMEPVYQNHQLVWVQSCNSLRPGEVGIFVYDGSGYIKAYDEQEPSSDEIENYIDSNGVLHKQAVLKSFNPDYEPKIVTQNIEFKICGRVLS